MMKYIVVLIFLLFFKGCYRCNDKTYYSIEEDGIKSEQLHTNKLSEILLLDKELLFYLVNPSVIPKMKLKKIEIYYKSEKLGEKVIDKNLSEIKNLEGRHLQYDISDVVLKYLSGKEEELQLQSNSYLSQPFYIYLYIDDVENNKKYVIKKVVAASKRFKGCRQWVPYI